MTRLRSAIVSTGLVPAEISLSPDRRLLAVTNTLGSVRLYSPTSLELKATLKSDFVSRSLAWHPDGNLLVTMCTPPGPGEKSRGLQIISVPGGRAEEASIAYSGELPQSMKWLVFHPDGTLLVGGTRCLRFYDVIERGIRLKKSIKGYFGYWGVLSEDGEDLAYDTRNTDHAYYCLEEQREVVLEELPVARDSQDGERWDKGHTFAVVQYDNDTYLLRYDMDRMVELPAIMMPNLLYPPCCQSPNGRLIAFGGMFGVFILGTETVFPQSASVHPGGPSKAGYIDRVTASPLVLHRDAMVKPVVWLNNDVLFTTSENGQVFRCNVRDIENIASRLH